MVLDHEIRNISPPNQQQQDSQFGSDVSQNFSQAGNSLELKVKLSRCLFQVSGLTSPVSEDAVGDISTVPTLSVLLGPLVTSVHIVRILISAPTAFRAHRLSLLPCVSLLTRRTVL